jgi:murein DD-endopeptidase MepM/ murein hydrolase activator NlpD
VRKFLLLASVVVLAACSGACQSSAAGASDGRGRDVMLPRDRETIEARVPRNATLETLLRQQHVPGDMAASVVAAVTGVFNPRNLRANQPYRLTRSLDGLFQEFRYEIDAGRFLRVIFREHNADGVPQFDVNVEPYPKEIAIDAVSAEISRAHSSLTAALDAAGENVQLALDLADAFGGEVDFNSDLRQGDRIDVLFERVMRDGTFAGYGAVRAATLTNGGRTITAIRHTATDGTSAWYDDQGRSLKRQFLASPLRFDPNPQVTSGFSYQRVHPIYGDVRAHLGVDYGAPEGAPVVSVSAGTVESAGMNGDAGRMVLIRHAGGYETAYLHLSSFAAGIHAGVHVDQGQGIGRVGSSGAATGPHLDFRLKKNGTYVNPMIERKKMPAGEPIPAALYDAFTRERDQALTEMKARLIAATPASPPHPASR